MFVVNMKAKRLKIFLIAFSIFFVLILAGIVAIERVDFSPVKDYATCDEISKYSLNAQTQSERETFLQQFDICVKLESEMVSEVKIPAEFNKTYEEYNELQRKIGLDLTPYSSKTVLQFQYRIDDVDENVVLLTYKGKVIGGHISSGVYGENDRALTDKL